MDFNASQTQRFNAYPAPEYGPTELVSVPGSFRVDRGLFRDPKGESWQPSHLVTGAKVCQVQSHSLKKQGAIAARAASNCPVSMSIYVVVIYLEYLTSFTSLRMLRLTRSWVHLGP